MLEQVYDGHQRLQKRLQPPKLFLDPNEDEKEPPEKRRRLNDGSSVPAPTMIPSIQEMENSLEADAHVLLKAVAKMSEQMMNKNLISKERVGQMQSMSFCSQLFCLSLKLE